VATVISIVSGKGGSGKSLLTAVLGRALAREGKKVLLVDMDIFVRGLTVLLFGFARPDREGGQITVSDLLGVFSEGSEERPPVATNKKNYMIQRFFECDLLPAVDNIAAPLDYDDRNLGNESFASNCVENLVNSVNEDYDYIVLDNRAGMDSLIAASCRSAKIVIAVAEDDAVGRQTNVNLIRFLQTRRYAKVVYTILNKARHIKSYEDLKQRALQSAEFSTLGVIPFDIEVLEDFGSDRFWVTVMQTLYFRAAIDTWNALSRTEHVTEISESKYSFPPKIFMNPRQGRFSLVERMVSIYSVLLMIGGGFSWIYLGFIRNKTEFGPEQFALMAAIVGAIMLFISVSGLFTRLKDAASERDERKR
jgi:septum site-determining protein MinD